jgi:hypothetical protein
VVAMVVAIVVAMMVVAMVVAIVVAMMVVAIVVVTLLLVMEFWSCEVTNLVIKFTKKWLCHIASYVTPFSCRLFLLRIYFFQEKLQSLSNC